MSQPYAAGAICSTVGDLVKWNRALHTGKVVSGESYALMTTPEGAAAKGPLKYGFGLGRDTIGGRPVITHGGGIHGFSSANAWVPSAELSVTVLANSSTAPADQLQRQLTRAALGIPLDKPPMEVPLAAADRVKYLGVYALVLPNGPRDFTIAEADDHLTAQLAGQGANPMLYYGDDTFGMNFDPALRLIFTVERGRATKVTLLQGGGRFEGARK
jgi:CubicO group peptidase (beta-lactamase class C family)